jgi:hypothetical protein
MTMGPEPGLAPAGGESPNSISAPPLSASAPLREPIKSSSHTKVGKIRAEAQRRGGVWLLHLRVIPDILASGAGMHGSGASNPLQ